MRKILLLYIMLCASVLLLSCTSRNRKGYEYHNPDIARMGLAQLENVAQKTKCEDCRYDALYRLYHTYKRVGKLYTLYDFAIKFPHSEFADSALAIVLPKSDSLYAVAIKQNTIDAWSDFIVKVPVPLQHDAPAVLDSLKWETQKHKWETDDKAWQEALRINQLQSFERYLSLYPNGAHASQAMQKKEEIGGVYMEHHMKEAFRQAAYAERQRQLEGDISNVGVWAVVDSLIAVHGNPYLYHYESIGNSDIYVGEQYTHTYTIGRNKNKPLSEIKKIYLKDYYKLWKNRHFDILIQFKWKAENIIVQHTTTNGHVPISLMKENGTITRLPSYKSIQALVFEEQNKKK